MTPRQREKTLRESLATELETLDRRLGSTGMPDAATGAHPFDVTCFQ